MKKLIIPLALAAVVSIVALAQDAEPKAEQQPEAALPPSLTYTNGMSARIAVSDEVYRQLRTVYKLTGATNAFSKWLTNNVRIELSLDASAFLRTEVQSIARQVMKMGAGPSDDIDLPRIRNAAKP